MGTLSNGGSLVQGLYSEEDMGDSQGDLGDTQEQEGFKIDSATEADMVESEKSVKTAVAKRDRAADAVTAAKKSGATSAENVETGQKCVSKATLKEQAARARATKAREHVTSDQIIVTAKTGEASAAKADLMKGKVAFDKAVADKAEAGVIASQKSALSSLETASSEKAEKFDQAAADLEVSQAASQQADATVTTREKETMACSSTHVSSKADEVKWKKTATDAEATAVNAEEKEYVAKGKEAESKRNEKAKKSEFKQAKANADNDAETAAAKVALAKDMEKEAKAVSTDIALQVEQRAAKKEKEIKFDVKEKKKLLDLKLKEQKATDLVEAEKEFRSKPKIKERIEKRQKTMNQEDKARKVLRAQRAATVKTGLEIAQASIDDAERRVARQDKRLADLKTRLDANQKDEVVAKDKIVQVAAAQKALQTAIDEAALATKVYFEKKAIDEEVTVKRDTTLEVKQKKDSVEAQAMIESRKKVKAASESSAKNSRRAYDEARRAVERNKKRQVTAKSRLAEALAEHEVEVKNFRKSNENVKLAEENQSDAQAKNELNSKSDEMLEKKVLEFQKKVDDDTAERAAKADKDKEKAENFQKQSQQISSDNEKVDKEAAKSDEQIKVNGMKSTESAATIVRINDLLAKSFKAFDSVTKELDAASFAASQATGDAKVKQDDIVKQLVDKKTEKEAEKLKWEDALSKENEKAMTLKNDMDTLKQKKVNFDAAKEKNQKKKESFQEKRANQLENAEKQGEKEKDMKASLKKVKATNRETQIAVRATGKKLDFANNEVDKAQKALETATGIKDRKTTDKNNAEAALKARSDAVMAEENKVSQAEATRVAAKAKLTQEIKVEEEKKLAAQNLFLSSLEDESITQAKEADRKYKRRLERATEMKAELALEEVSNKAAIEKRQTDSDAISTQTIKLKDVFEERKAMYTDAKANVALAANDAAVIAAKKTAQDAFDEMEKEELALASYTEAGMPAHLAVEAARSRASNLKVKMSVNANRIARIGDGLTAIKDLIKRKEQKMVDNTNNEVRKEKEFKAMEKKQEELKHKSYVARREGFYAQQRIGRTDRRIARTERRRKKRMNKVESAIRAMGSYQVSVNKGDIIREKKKVHRETELLLRATQLVRTRAAAQRDIAKEMTEKTNVKLLAARASYAVAFQEKQMAMQSLNTAQQASTRAAKVVREQLSTGKSEARTQIENDNKVAKETLKKATDEATQASIAEASAKAAVDQATADTKRATVEYEKSVEAFNKADEKQEEVKDSLSVSAKQLASLETELQEDQQKFQDWQDQEKSEKTIDAEKAKVIDAFDQLNKANSQAETTRKEADSNPEKLAPIAITPVLKKPEPEEVDKAEEPEDEEDDEDDEEEQDKKDKDEPVKKKKTEDHWLHEYVAERQEKAQKTEDPILRAQFEKQAQSATKKYKELELNAETPPGEVNGDTMDSFHGRVTSQSEFAVKEIEALVAPKTK